MITSLDGYVEGKGVKMIPNFYVSSLAYMTGSFCIVGGIIGYVKVNSVASIVVGSLSGLALLFSTSSSQLSTSTSLWADLVISSLLALRFIGVYMKTHQVFPGLIMSTLSSLLALSVLYLLITE